MNIEQAKCIPMSEILGKINSTPSKQTEIDAWYNSPLRSEKTPSFHVSKQKNVWFDFGTGDGGDTIKFVCAYLKSTNESDTIADALRWLKNMIGSPNQSLPIFKPTPLTKDKLLELKDVKALQHFGLKNYLSSRGITLKVAHTYLKEVRVLNKKTLKTIIALGLKNEENGYEIRNPTFKSCVGTKSISFIRGSEPKPKGINIFEGMFDFLSVVVNLNGKPLKNDSIILNSTSLLNRAIPYIKNYGYDVAYSWMDNDDTGKTATKTIEDFCKSESNLVHKSMQNLYLEFNDVNAWHTHKNLPQ